MTELREKALRLVEEMPEENLISAIEFLSHRTQSADAERKKIGRKVARVQKIFNHRNGH